MEKAYEVYFEDGEGIANYATSPYLAMAKAIKARYDQDGSESFPEHIIEVKTGNTFEVDLTIV